ncbi:HAD family hydrolase [Falsibacillus pallidus]|uniref:HAD family hydrolase n=1 Tax=Falsibacillus pallidus TaxID=493781 RepID=UPI003D95A1D7
MIKTVLFDVDGVLLSEEKYFDASALTVWELLHSRNYLGLSPENFRTNYNEQEIKEIRSKVFVNDSILEFLKSRGLNANWDMIYLTFSFQLIWLLSQTGEKNLIEEWVDQPIKRDTLLKIGSLLIEKSVTLNFEAFIDEFPKFQQTKQGLMECLDILVQKKLGIEKSTFIEKGSLWSICEHVSQEWYVGDDNVLQSTGRPSVQLGKKGFLNEERTLAPSADIKSLFKQLDDANISIGIGTGRPRLETIEPFDLLGWLPFFNENHIITADDVLLAQKENPEGESLSKPHPFTYVMAIMGRDKGIQSCLKKDLPLPSAEEILVVGDSLADLLAARKIGCRFAAVLTGLTGEKARETFDSNGADFILDNVMDLKMLIEKGA